jgi:hypothetical protein
MQQKKTHEHEREVPEHASEHTSYVLTNLSRRKTVHAFARTAQAVFMKMLPSTTS